VATGASVGPGRFFKFGRGISSIQDINWTQVKQPNFYNEKDTNLEGLLRTFIQRSQNNDAVPRAFIVITDGIQSVPGRRENALFTDAILNANKGGLGLNLFASRADFYGEVYSESQRGITLGKYDSGQHGDRPFFAYVFSEDGSTGDEFMAYLKDVNFSLLNFSREMIEPIKVSYSAPYTFNKSKNGLQEYSVHPPVVNLRMKNGNENADGYLIVREVLNLKNFRLDSVEALRFCGEARTVEAEKAKGPGNNTEEKDQASGEQEKVKKPKGDAAPLGNPKIFLVDKKIVEKKVVQSEPTELYQMSIEYVLRFQRMGHDMVAYTLSLCGYIPKPPKWVEDLSTDSDESIKSFNKVPYFSDTMAALLKKAFDKRTIGYAVVKER